MTAEYQVTIRDYLGIAVEAPERVKGKKAAKTYAQSRLQSLKGTPGPRQHAEVINLTDGSVFMVEFDEKV